MANDLPELEPGFYGWEARDKSIPVTVTKIATGGNHRWEACWWHGLGPDHYVTARTRKLALEFIMAWARDSGKLGGEHGSP
jgi:hypothetical protein